MMTAKGLAKLIEECGELQQVAGKKLAYFNTDDHPDGSLLSLRMQDEIADVIAAARFVARKFNLDCEEIEARIGRKFRLFERWDADPTNHADAAPGFASDAGDKHETN